MKKLILIIILSLFVAVLLESCDNNLDEMEMIETSHSNHGSEFTASQISVLAKLYAINDSICDLDNPQNLNETRGSINWGKVITSDVKGFSEGWGYAWSNTSNKGFAERVKLSIKVGLVFAISYSAASIGLQVVYGLPSSYSLSDVQKSMAISFNSDRLQQEYVFLQEEYPQLIIEENETEIKNALLHNISLENLENGVVVPIAVLNSAFTEDELNFMSTVYFNRYYNATEKIVTGEISFSNFCSVYPVEYMEEVVNAYVNGINRLSQSNLTTYQLKLQNLCSQYVETVKNEMSIDESKISMLKSILYMGPISYEHWKSVQN